MGAQAALLKPAKKPSHLEILKWRLSIARIYLCFSSPEVTIVKEWVTKILLNVEERIDPHSQEREESTQASFKAERALLSPEIQWSKLSCVRRSQRYDPVQWSG